MLVNLRPYQQKAVDSVRDSYRAGFRSPLLVLSTGAGKTVIFCDITEKVAARGKSILILVHRQELLRQTSEHLDRLGVVHGLIAPGHSMTGDHVQVASVQTLIHRLDKIKEPDLIVIDECHHAVAGSWRKVLDAWQQSRVLGVTATPVRLDGSGLGVKAGGYFDILIEGPSIRELIDGGFLAPSLLYAPPAGIDLAEVKTRAGDYASDQLSAAVDKPTITGCAISHYQRICPNVPAIAFCASVKHAEHVAEQFNAVGIVAQSLTGTMADSVRKYRIQALGSGQISVLTSCDIISEGTDIPIVTTAILLRPTQSMGLYLQQIGRCMRPHAQKSHAIILDHAGNCFRHGMPDDIRAWTLNGEKKRKKKTDVLPRIRQCEQCFAVFSVFLQQCPQCGAVVGASNPRKIKQVAGELIPMDESRIALLKKAARREVGMSRSLEELIQIGKNRGYKPEWAYRLWHIRKSRQNFAGTGT